MHVLFIHQNFPAQFQHIAPRLVRDHGWRCTFVTEKAEGSLPGVEKVIYKSRGGASAANHVCTRAFENAVGHAHGVYDALKGRPDIQPDLVVAHSGFGSSLYLPYLCDAPIINFFEYFYHPVGQDLGYRPELPVTEVNLLRVRTRNAMILLDLENCDRGWTATHYQRGYFPKAYQDKINVIFDGINTDIYHRKDNPARQVAPDQCIDPKLRIVTYVARGFEMMRGFDIFMKAAKRIYEQYPDVIFVVVGTDRVYYGGDMQYVKTASLRHHVLGQEQIDRSKFIFTGYVAQETLADILSISDLHIYLTEPFIASWSMVDAMACGAVVLASDQTCVREYITHGQNGLLCDFFDHEAMAKQAVEVLKDPAAYRHLGEAARRTVTEKYSLDVVMPRLLEFFTQTAATPRSPSVRASLLVKEGTMPRVRTAEEVGAKVAAMDAEHELAVAANASAGEQPGRSSEAACEQAVAMVRGMLAGSRTAIGWVQAAQAFRGPGPLFLQLGPRNHPEDMARLMARLTEWKPGLVVDLGEGDGGRLLLWARVAADKARLIAAALPGRPYSPSKAPFFQAMGRAGQTVDCIPYAADYKALAAHIEKQCGGRKIDFLFMDGMRPYEQLRADFRYWRNRVRRNGLIAWDGVRPVGALGPDHDGGDRLWTEVQPMYPFRAEYLAGSKTPVGGIVMVRL